MAVKVYWTAFAEGKLKDIFDYFKFKANVKIAKSLTKGLIDTSLLLENNPYLGAKEELLKERLQDFRYLIYKNYKIIYWIDTEKTIVFIANVFDCRQNPEKLPQEINE